MRSERNTEEKSILIVTGSTLLAEQIDRPLAYQLKSVIEGLLVEESFGVLVLGDLWYLNNESLHGFPTISVGQPRVNALAVQLYDKLENSIVVDHSIVVQMDPHFNDLRVSIWGAGSELTANALDLFITRGYLERFLEAAIIQLT